MDDFRIFAGMLDSGKTFKNQMRNKRVKRLILEIYIATGTRSAYALAMSVRECPFPVLHLNLDLWTCRITHEKYIEIRRFSVEVSWEMRSLLLAVSGFRPAPTMSSSRISEPLKLWCEKIFNNFTIDRNKLCSSTSDAGPDVKRLLSTPDYGN